MYGCIKTRIWPISRGIPPPPPPPLVFSGPMAMGPSNDMLPRASLRLSPALGACLNPLTLRIALVGVMATSWMYSPLGRNSRYIHERLRHLWRYPSNGVQVTTETSDRYYHNMSYLRMLVEKHDKNLCDEAEMGFLRANDEN